MSCRYNVVVTVVIERDGCFLLLRRSTAKEHAPGEWETVSGRVHGHETPVDAARREAREETGLDVTIAWPFDTFRFLRGPAKEPAIGIAFLAFAGVGEVALSDEHDAAEWIPFDRLREAPVPEVVRRSLETLVDLLAARGVKSGVKPPGG